MLAKTIHAVDTYTVGQLIDDFVSYCSDVECLSKWTMTTRSTHLRQFKTYCDSKKLYDIEFLTNKFVDGYFVEYAKTRSQNTTNTGKRILKVFISWVHDYKEIDLHVNRDAIRLVRTIDTTPRYIERSVIENAIRCARNTQDRILIAVAFEAGLRISELVSLCICDVHDGFVHVRGKGAIERNVPISDRLFATIEAFIRDNQQTHILFTNEDLRSDGSMKIKTARAHIQAAFERVGVKMYPHQLRHSLAIELLKNGCDLVTIQRVLGHSDLKTTQKYLRIGDTYMKSQYDKYLCHSVL